MKQFLDVYEFKTAKEADSFLREAYAKYGHEVEISTSLKYVIELKVNPKLVEQNNKEEENGKRKKTTRRSKKTSRNNVE